jgi:predicted MFS family arabinose efflux permease
MAISPLSLAMLWPLPLICVAALCLGVAIEIMMVQWTVALTRNIPQDKLARVFAYDAVGSVLAMPAGALAVGPIAGLIGVSATQYGAAAVIVVAAAFALTPRDVRMMRTGALPRQRARAVASSGT